MDKNTEIVPKVINNADKPFGDPDEPVGSPHICMDDDIFLIIRVVPQQLDWTFFYVLKIESIQKFIENILVDFIANRDFVLAALSAFFYFVI